MNLKSILFSAIGLICISFTNADAAVHMSPLFTDNMVMQQKTNAPIWGTATPGATVTIVTSWNNAKYSTVAGENGKWMVNVRTAKAGGPYSMTVTEAGSEPVKISNILMGEVWLCSGQSNMQMPVKGDWAKVHNCDDEVKNAGCPNIRLLSVQRITSSRPEDDFPTYGDGWQICSPETVAEFSATAYFFGRELHLRKNVPVGLVHSSWGGTTIEAWMSKDALAGVKDLGSQAEYVSTWPAEREDRRIQTQKARDAFLHIMSSAPFQTALLM